MALGEDFYRARGIEIMATDRGGKVTYHGPGQLVGYPIMRVHDIGAHLRKMEAAMVAALPEHGILARSRCDEGIDYTGVWVEGLRKYASIGVRGGDQTGAQAGSGLPDRGAHTRLPGPGDASGR